MTKMIMKTGLVWMGVSLVFIGCVPSQRPAELPKDISLDLGGNVSLKLTLIPAGKFTMGMSDEDYWRLYGRIGDENFHGPPHSVTISKPFYMGIYEVTLEEYAMIMCDPSQSRDVPFTTPYLDGSLQRDPLSKVGRYPTNELDRDQAASFCEKLSRKTGMKVRLPTEAEWEYACRAGSSALYSYGDRADPRKLAEYAWDDGEVHPVGQKKPNDWGLYDMHGEVGEWCSDWWAYSYPAGSATDPVGPAAGEKAVVRGGSVGRVDPTAPITFRTASVCSSRCPIDPLDQRDTVGFRVIVEMGKPEK